MTTLALQLVPEPVFWVGAIMGLNVGVALALLAISGIGWGGEVLARLWGRMRGCAGAREKCR